VAVYAGTNIFVPGTGPLTIGAGGLTNNVAATLIYAPVELAAAQTWGIGQDLTVYGQIRSQSSGLTKTGAGALTLSGNNNNLIGGAFAASGGPLQIFNGVHTFSSTFTVSGNNTLTVVSNATVSSTADSVTLASSGSGSKAIVRGGHGLGRPECLNKDLRLGLDLDRFRTVD
jgi:autotransporter-associated beta strand protein